MRQGAKLDEPPVVQKRQAQAVCRRLAGEMVGAGTLGSGGMCVHCIAAMRAVRTLGRCSARQSGSRELAWSYTWLEK